MTEASDPTAVPETAISWNLSIHHPLCWSQDPESLLGIKPSPLSGQAVQVKLSISCSSKDTHLAQSQPVRAVRFRLVSSNPGAGQWAFTSHLTGVIKMRLSFLCSQLEGTRPGAAGNHLWHYQKVTTQEWKAHRELMAKGK